MHRRIYIPDQSPRRPIVQIRKVSFDKGDMASCHFCDQNFKADELIGLATKKGTARAHCPKCGARFYVFADGSIRTGLTSSERPTAA
jgi:uncharacterized paraquat-inducible protein A